MRRGLRPSVMLGLLVLLVVGGLLVLHPSAGLAESGQKWAVLVGVDSYKDDKITPLKYAEADARAVRDALVDSAGFPRKNTFLLTSGGEGNERAEASKIIERVEAVARETRPGDTFLFYFAGHGVVRGENMYLLSQDTNVFSIRTLDMTAVQVSTLKAVLRGIQATCLLTFVDACRNDPESGRAMAGTTLSSAMARDLRLDGEAIGNSSRDLVSATFYSCSLNERSWEWADKRQGFFSYFVARGLRGEAADAQGRVTVTSLGRYLGEQVPRQVRMEVNQQQRPYVEFGNAAGREVLLALVQGRPGTVAAPLAPSTSAAVAPSAPVVSISAPLAGQKVDGDKVFLAAMVSGGGPLQEVSVSVDGRPVSMGSGAVRHTSGGAVLNVPLPLSEGQHTIVVLALGQTGAPGQAAVTVVRDRTEAPAPAPRPSPAAQLAAVPAYPQVPASGARPREMTNPKDGSLLVLVPAGPFRMGSEDGDTDEKPVHVVTLRDYYIGRCEVTNAQFERFVGETNHDAGPEWKKYAGQWGAQAPVVCVSWDDAQAYCRWAGGRLPTEAEWEKAARGTDGRRYPWGDTWDSSRAWCGESSGGQAHPVGLLPAGVSPYGCLDMAGNVWEWCGDWFGAYPSGPVVDPTGPSSGSYRVARGGSWRGDAQFARAALRNSGDPDLRRDYLGFRLARSLP